MSSEIAVRHVQGRYPRGRAALRSENIVASVTEVSRLYRIRLDDDQHPDAWTEILIEVNSDDIIVGEPLDESMPLFDRFDELIPPPAEEDIPF